MSDKLLFHFETSTASPNVYCNIWSGFDDLLAKYDAVETQSIFFQNSKHMPMFAHKALYQVSPCIQSLIFIFPPSYADIQYDFCIKPFNTETWFYYIQRVAFPNKPLDIVMSIRHVSYVLFKAFVKNNYTKWTLQWSVRDDLSQGRHDGINK